MDKDSGKQPEVIDEERREVSQWLWRIPVLAVAAGGAYGAIRAVVHQFVRKDANPNPEFTDRPDVHVGTLADFPAEWDDIEFALPTETGAQLPAVAVRIPQAVPGSVEIRNAVDVVMAHIIAFSRICTHQQCVVSMNRDLNAIKLGFNHDTNTPAITCPCHLSVFDPLQGGKAVSGAAEIPLPRVRLRYEAGAIIADGFEIT